MISFLNRQTGRKRTRLLKILDSFVEGLLTPNESLRGVAGVFEDELPADTGDILNHAFTLRQAGAWKSFNTLLEYQPANQPLARRHVVLVWRYWTSSCRSHVVEPQPDPFTQQRLGTVVVPGPPSQATSSLFVDDGPVDLDDTPSPSADTGDKTTNSKQSHPSDEGS